MLLLLLLHAKVKELMHRTFQQPVTKTVKVFRVTSWKKNTHIAEKVAYFGNADQINIIFKSITGLLAAKRLKEALH